MGPSGASGPLGLIRIATFNGKTAEAFREALVTLKVGGREQSGGPLASCIKSYIDVLVFHLRRGKAPIGLFSTSGTTAAVSSLQVGHWPVSSCFLAFS